MGIMIILSLIRFCSEPVSKGSLKIFFVISHAIKNLLGGLQVLPLTQFDFYTIFSILGKKYNDQIVSRTLICLLFHRLGLVPSRAY